MVLFTSKNSDIPNQSVGTSFFTSEKYRMTNQLASLGRRVYFYLNAFWSVNFGMYIITTFISYILIEKRVTPKTVPRGIPLFIER